MMNGGVSGADSKAIKQRGELMVQPKLSDVTPPVGPTMGGDLYLSQVGRAGDGFPSSRHLGRVAVAGKVQTYGLALGFGGMLIVSAGFLAQAVVALPAVLFTTGYAVMGLGALAMVGGAFWRRQQGVEKP